MAGILAWLVNLLPSVLAAVYTVNFGRWMKRNGHRSGSWGAYLWAGFCVMVPAAVLWYNR